MQFIFPEAVMIDSLNGLIGAGKVLDQAVVALACNTDILTDQSDFADLILPTYGGYAHSTAVVWGTVRHKRDGHVEALAGSKTFAPTDASASSTVTYAVLLDTTGATLLAVLLLDTPVTLSTPDDSLTICFPVILGQTILPPSDVVP